MQLQCDSHVHFYTQAVLEAVAASLPYALPKPHPLGAYLDALMAAGKCPSLINHVHLSILPDSENVFRSFNELEILQQQHPETYGHIRLVGTIKADPGYASQERLNHPQVKGIRIVLHDKKPETIAGDDYSSREWLAMFSRMRKDQHVHIYAKHPASNLKVLRQIPENIMIAIDHLGICYPELGTDSHEYQALLHEAKKRGNVFFKGPGYRTAIAPEKVAPFVQEIIRVVDVDKLVLEASDAPHVGSDDAGMEYAGYFSPEKAFTFTHSLAMNVAGKLNIPVEDILNKNIKNLIQP